MANARHVPYQRLGPELWKKTITDQRRSGLSQAEFCHQQGLSLSTFQRWRARLAETAEDSPPSPPPATASPPGFVALEVLDRDDGSSSETLELLFPSGLKIRVPPSFEGTDRVHG